MSAFDDAFAAAALPAQMDRFGTSGQTYTPESGSAVTLTAIIGAESYERIQTVDGFVKRYTRNVTISTDPDSKWKGVADPQLTATFTVVESDATTATYSIEDVPSRAAGFAVLKLIRSPAMELTRPRYRRAA